MEYIQRIAGNVIYAEDNVYRLMMFDGIVADYFQKNGILYEFGSGISTSRNQEWLRKIAQDWDAADQLMLSPENKKTEFQEKMVKAIQRKKHGGKLRRKVALCMTKGKLQLICKNRFARRMTANKL